MTIVKTINVKQTSDYNFVIVKDEFGMFHSAYQFFNCKERIRLLSGDTNRKLGYKTEGAARRGLNQYIKAECMTIESVC